MLDGLETVEIAGGELHREGARQHGTERLQHVGRRGNRANSLRRAGRERDSMLDGEETVEIAWGELRWEGARQRAGRTGNRGNSSRRASPGGSETACDRAITACWTERKPWK